MIIGVSWLGVFVVCMAANLVSDIYEYCLERCLGRRRNWHLVERWVAYLGRGVLAHKDISYSSAMRHEFALGWLFHNWVGIYFAALYLIILAMGLHQPPGQLSGLAFGLVTVLAPWLILIPGQGGGILARKSTRPNFIRLTSLSVHVVFGISLYLVTLLYAAIW